MSLSECFFFFSGETIDCVARSLLRWAAQGVYTHFILSEQFTRNAIITDEKANKTLDVIFYSFTTCMKSQITLIKVSRNKRFRDAEFVQVDSPRGLHKIHLPRNLDENIQAKRASRHYLLTTRYHG